MPRTEVDTHVTEIDGEEVGHLSVLILGLEETLERELPAVPDDCGPLSERLAVAQTLLCSQLATIAVDFGVERADEAAEMIADGLREQYRSMLRSVEVN